MKYFTHLRSFVGFRQEASSYLYHLAGVLGVRHFKFCLFQLSGLHRLPSTTHCTSDFKPSVSEEQYWNPGHCENNLVNYSGANFSFFFVVGWNNVMTSTGLC